MTHRTSLALILFCIVAIAVLIIVASLQAARG